MSARLRALAAVVLFGCAFPTRAPMPPGSEIEGLIARRFGSTERALVVAVEGLTPAAVDPAGDPLLPGVARLAARGVVAESVEPVAPSATQPAHTSLVTGERPAQHGVTADRMLGERGVRRETYGHASAIRSATLWQRAGERGRPVAAIGWPVTVGAGVALLLPEVFPMRAGETAASLLADTATRALFPVAERAGALRPDAQLPGPERDHALAGVACEILRAEADPVLLLLRLSQTGVALRAHGPGSPEAREAFRAADREVTRLLGCLHEADRLATTAILVVGDHGMLAVHTAVAPNASLAAAGLLRIEADTGRVAAWSAIARSNGGSSFVYARSERAALAARVRLVAAAEESRAFRVVSAEEMLRVGADPEAWFGLEARPGYVFDDGWAGPLLRPAAERAAGGYLPGRPEMQPGFVAFGAGIRGGVRVPWMRQTDVAPTVARLLRFDLGAVDGRPLVGALATPAEPAAGEGSSGG